MGYDLVGNLEHFTYPNGVTHAYQYTEQNRLRALQLTNAAGTVLRGYTHTLEPSGVIVTSGLSITHKYFCEE